ncbi:MAG: hypothetical protein ACI9DC_005214 [Gammaproteobacteria bacterium]|jgi:hypothetical protein
MKLDTSPASGNAHTCDLLLVLLGVEHESIAVDLAANGSRTGTFLAINPRGKYRSLLKATWLFGPRRRFWPGLRDDSMRIGFHSSRLR